MQHLKACTCRPLIINQLTYQVFATVPQPTNTVLCAVVLFFAFTSFAGINSLVYRREPIYRTNVEIIHRACLLD